MKAGSVYISVRGDDKRLQGDLDKAHRKVASSAKKMEQSIVKGFKRASIAVGAAIAVIGYKAVSLVKESALLAARFETLDIVMKQVGKNAGYTAEQMEKFDKDLRTTGISMIESRNSLARMAQAQLDLTKATKLGRIAQDAAVIGNINSSEAFQRMIYGIQSGQTEVLKTIGINVNFQKSYQAVADATGKAANSFSETQKALIRQNTVLEYGKRIAGTYEAAMTTAGKKLSSFTRYVEDFKVKMGLAFGPATVTLVDAATKAMKEFQVEISKPEAQKAMESFASNLAKSVVLLGKDLPSKIGAITSKLEGIWKVISYDPAIIEWGLVGLALGGKKGALLMGSLAHMTTWASNLSAALGLVSMGVVDISQVATANFKELQGLVDNFGKLPELKFYKITQEVEKEAVAIEKGNIALSKRIALISEMASPAESDAQLIMPYMPSLSELIHEEEERLAVVEQFNERYAELGMSRFELERLQLEREVELWASAGVDKENIARLTSRKLTEIALAERQAKLAIYSDMAGQIAGTFMQISQAGGEQSKEAFRMYQAFAGVQAMISAHLAASAALANPLLIAAFPANIVVANMLYAMGVAKVAMIAAASPPSYDEGGISSAKGVYQTGDISEAHIPLKGGKVPVSLAGGAPQVQINVIDNTSEKKNVTSEDPYYDGERWVMNVILDSVDRNRNNFGSNLKTVLGKI